MWEIECIIEKFDRLINIVEGLIAALSDNIRVLLIRPSSFHVHISPFHSLLQIFSFYQTYVSCVVNIIIKKVSFTFPESRTKAQIYLKKIIFPIYLKQNKSLKFVYEINKIFKTNIHTYKHTSFFPFYAKVQLSFMSTKYQEIQRIFSENKWSNTYARVQEHCISGWINQDR